MQSFRFIVPYMSLEPSVSCVQVSAVRSPPAATRAGRWPRACESQRDNTPKEQRSVCVKPLPVDESCTHDCWWALSATQTQRCTLNKDVHTQANARVSLWLFYPQFVGFVHFEATHEHISVSCTYSTTSRMWAFKECQQDVSSTLLIS